jgi:magnesium chelatase family protein
MQHAMVLSSTMRGVDSVLVHIEVDLGGGLPSFTMVGLADAAVREARVRVQAAIENSGFQFPLARMTVNLAPAHLRKDGSGFDLPMALGILAAHGAIPAAALARCLFLGELSLNGDVRPVRGALAAAEAARSAGCACVLVATDNVMEAALVEGVEARAVRSLADAVAFLCAGAEERAPRAAPRAHEPARRAVYDLSDVKGQGFARRALEIAAAGAHNTLFVGGPGAGKTMLARRMPGILPPMTRDEALEVTRVHSVAGLTIGSGLAQERPFRAPHHSTTPQGLVGGGAPLARPGEVSLAHHGVLFLDELPEFARTTLEVLREPLESGEVMLSRASGTLRYPARTVLIASMNPCPCGYRHDPRRRCRCGPADVARYQARVSGPLLDRMDLHVSVPPVDLAALQAQQPGESSQIVAERVAKARARQIARQGVANAHLPARARDEVIVLCAEGQALLMRAVEALALSARGHDRVLRIARTLADLEASPAVRPTHLREALSYRALPATDGATAAHVGQPPAQPLGQQLGPPSRGTHRPAPL